MRSQWLWTMTALSLCSCAASNAERQAAAPDEKSTQSLYDRYGGAPTVKKVVLDAVAAALSDCKVAPFFAVLGQPGHGSVDRVESCLVLQVSALMGGKDANGKPILYPGRATSLANDAAGYDCQDMSSAHVEAGIPGPVFDQFVSDLVGVLQADGVSGRDIQALAPYITGLRTQIVSPTASNLDSAQCAIDPAAHKAVSPDHSLYAKYGGAPTVRKLVTDAINGVLHDCRLAPYFALVGQAGHDSVDHLESCLDLQLKAALGGRRTDESGSPLLDAGGNPMPFLYPGVAESFGKQVDGGGNPVTYRCADMVSAHAYLGIPGGIFDQFMSDVGAVLAADGVSSPDIQAIAGVLNPLKPLIVSATPTVLPACEVTPAR